MFPISRRPVLCCAVQLCCCSFLSDAASAAAPPGFYSIPYYLPTYYLYPPFIHSASFIPCPVLPSSLHTAPLPASICCSSTYPLDTQCWAAIEPS